MCTDVWRTTFSTLKMKVAGSSDTFLVVTSQKTDLIVPLCMQITQHAAPIGYDKSQ